MNAFFKYLPDGWVLLIKMNVTILSRPHTQIREKDDFAAHSRSVIFVFKFIKVK
jgi:hypothetical protein